MVNIFIDGSSPIEKIYPSAYCIFKENKLIYTKVLEENLPAQDVEYLALIEALELIKEEIIEGKKVRIFTDCNYMLQEIKGIRNPKNLELLKKTLSLIEELKQLDYKIKLMRLSREQNRAGKYLELRLKRLVGYREEVSHPQRNPQLKKIRRRMIYKK